jgi:predicted secreted acid phosphatase
MRRRFRVTLFAGLALATAAAGRAAAPEPRNLSTLKDEIRTYVRSGEYDRAVAEVAAQAREWIESRARVELRQEGRSVAARRLAIVMDLDDTLFRNEATILAHDFAYDPAAWDAWVAAAAAPAVEPVREVYRTARRLGVDVIFLTSRRERERTASDRNLQAIGCGEYARLICQPDDAKQESGEFKREERRKLAAEGYVIIANIGDQLSDFTGGGAEREFKLPNPFYLTP